MGYKRVAAVCESIAVWYLQTYANHMPIEREAIRSDMAEYAGSDMQRRGAE